MRILLAGCGFSVDLGDEWVVSAGWSDASRQKAHGVHLRHDDGLQMSVIGHAGRVPRSLAELRALLQEQSWASAPHDEVIVDAEPMLISALFATVHRDIVLEGFISDGRHLANFAVPGPADCVIAVRSAAERLARSLRFEAS